MKFLFILALSCASFSAFSQINHCVVDRYSNDPTFDSLDIVRDEYIYSVEERWPSTTIDTLRMEVFKPSDAVDPLTERPFILMIHGGSFLDGSRADMNYLCMEMARRGFVVATMDYRLGWDCTPSLAYCIGCVSEASKLKVATYRAVQDARAAMRYAVDNASTLGIDTAAIFIQGTSAGSITALHTTFWDQAEADNFCPTCVSEVGTLDDSGLSPLSPFSIKAVVNNCGAIRNVDNMDGASIPVIGFHDANDCTVPIDANYVINCGNCTGFFVVSGSQSISNRLNANGVCNQLNTVPWELVPQHCSYPNDAIIGKSSCFLKSILCNSCTSSSTLDIWNIPDCSAGTTSVGLPTQKIEDLRIYPNPSNGQIRIRTYSDDVFSVQLLSLDGKDVKTIENVQNNQPLDFSEFNSGVYYLKISGANDEFTIRKVALQN